ncbi:MAG: hypothetical protein SVY53_14835, partial [Chloroflexota bacterium]|nr:hypothetical protein [Chloroflexota bacterium]
IRPRFIEDVPHIEEEPDSPETKTKTQDKLLELVRDEAFFKELVERVAELQQAGIKEKNIVGGDIKLVKKIRIGDKEYSPDDIYDRKNIVEGNIEDAEEFTLGDGHSWFAGKASQLSLWGNTRD